MKRVLKTCLIISTSEDLVISGTDEAVIVFVSEREREMNRDVVNGGGETTRWTEKARHEEIMEENRQEGSERL